MSRLIVHSQAETMRATGVLCLMIYQEIVAIFSELSRPAQVVYLGLFGLVAGWMSYR